ncbi:unnamed protein product, partial [Candidula unifasciata]
IKGTFTAKRGQENFNPFSQGSLLKNCMGVLCGPTPPSLIDRRGIVTQDPEPESHVSPVQSEKESNAVSAHHEYYGSTNITTQKTNNTGTNTGADWTSVVVTSELPPDSVKKRDMISYQTPDGSINNKVPPLNGTGVNSPQNCIGKKNHIWDMTLNQLDYLVYLVYLYCIKGNSLTISCPAFLVYLYCKNGNSLTISCPVYLVYLFCIKGNSMTISCPAFLVYLYSY